MVGNVAELINDWFRSYSAESVTDPSGPASGEYFVIRGGSWSDQYVFLSVASRRTVSPVGIGDWIGFRCASDTP